PDIPPLHFEDSEIEEIRESLPALPRELKSQYGSLGLDEANVRQLIDQPRLREMFDAVHDKTGDAKRASSLVLTQLLGFLNANDKPISEGPDADAILELVSKIDDGTISGNSAKDVLAKMVETGKNASSIIEEEGMQQISDESEIEELVEKAIAENPKAVESFKSGKEAALGAIVGWVMKESKGQADPAKVNEILKKRIG
ncbi:GatB/YqeY domain-containing protein, partial [Patescibacteria group bacterium]|nr:GatB/YqeY domain-containing protein [Patescibacteria group bacterium]